MILLLCLVLCAGAPDLVEIGRMRERDLVEVSGVVASRAYPGIFWVHNDSGNSNEIFAIERDGRLVARLRTPFPNIDWEDVAADDKGRLYLADTGNNFGRLPLRAVYRFDETNPRATKRTPPTEFTAFFYRFEAGKAFDCEGLFVENDVAYLVTKRRDRRPAEILSIPLGRPISPLAPVVPKFVTTLPDFVEPATGADLSADGRRLAVCSSGVVRIYRREGPSRLTTVAEVRYKERQIEAVAWDGADLILTDEPGRIYRIQRDEWMKHPPRTVEKGGREN